MRTCINDQYRQREQKASHMKKVSYGSSSKQLQITKSSFGRVFDIVYHLMNHWYFVVQRGVIPCTPNCVYEVAEDCLIIFPFYADKVVSPEGYPSTHPLLKVQLKKRWFTISLSKQQIGQLSFSKTPASFRHCFGFRGLLNARNAINLLLGEAILLQTMSFHLTLPPTPIWSLYAFVIE